MRLRERLRSVYFNTGDLTESQCRNNQKRLIVSSTVANVLLALTTGSFLAGFLSHLGASAQYCAVLGAIPQLGCIMQMLSPYIFERMKNRKLLICVCCFIFRFSLSTIVFVPLLVSSVTLRLALIMVIEIVAYLAAGFVTPGWNYWNLSIAPEKNRGRFLAVKDIISMLVVALISLGVGGMLDHYREKGAVMAGFTIMFSAATVLSVVDFLVASGIREPKVHTNDVQPTFRQIILKPLQDKPFRLFIVFLSIWSFAIQFSVSFIPVYMVTGLKFNFSFISAVTMAGNLFGMVAVYLWGSLADRTSWSFLMKVSGSIIALCYTGWFFVNGGNAKFLVPVLQVLLACCNGAFSMASMNLQFKISPPAGKTSYLGMASAISCVISFGGALLGSFIYSALENVQFWIGNMQIGNIQILFFSTSILLIISLLFKQKHGI